MGNTFAYIALVIWPLIAIYLYRTKSIQIATMWTILGGFMFLPVRTEIDFPMVPPFDKRSIPVISAILGCWFIKRQRIKYLGESRWVKRLMVIFLAGPFFTVELNSEPIQMGWRYMPGMTHYDAFSLIINQFFIIAPFFMGRQLFRTYENQLEMFRILVIAGLCYSLLMLFEIRMSPQLHTWFYGFFPHSFLQQIRYGGYRPVVFMGHGLWVAFFTTMVLISACVLWKIKTRIHQFSPSGVSYYLLMILVLCKSMASIVYGFVAFLLIIRTKFKTQYRVAIILVLLTLLYPALSIMKIFPHQILIDQLVSMGAYERAHSLKYRFNNEGMLLEHARKKFFFGWGSWGRNRVYNEETGSDESTTDGRWIITFGQFGLFGFIAEFGLLAIPGFWAYSASKLVKSDAEQTLLAAHAILVGMIMIDQLPNASLDPWLWLLSGILLGRAEEVISQDKTRRIKLEKIGMELKT